MDEKEKRWAEKVCMILAEWAAKSHNACLENASTKWVGPQPEKGVT